MNHAADVHQTILAIKVLIWESADFDNSITQFLFILIRIKNDYGFRRRFLTAVNWNRIDYRVVAIDLDCCDFLTRLTKRISR